MSGPWEKFASAAPGADDAKPWERFSQPAPAGPTWADVAKGAIRNAGKSFRENVIDPSMNAAETIMSPARGAAEIAAGKRPVPGMDTAKGLGTLIRSVGAFASDPETEFGVNQAELLKPGSTKDLRESQKKEQERGGKVLGAVRDHYVDRYGSMEGFKKALMADPVGVAMDAATLLSAGETAVSKVPALAKVAEKAGSVAGEIAGAPGEAAAHTVGHLSGVGPDAVKQAVKAGFERDKQFIEALNGKLPMEDTVKLAAKGIKAMRDQSWKEYQAAMKIAGLDGEPIDFNKILQGWQDAQKTGHFEGVALTERTEGLDKKLLDLLDKWYQNGQTNPKFFTGEGMDALKRAVGGILDNIPFEKRGDRRYVGDLYNVIKGQISEQAPLYDKIMANSRNSLDAIEEMERALSLNDKASYDTGIRKLLSAMRNNANSNYGNRLKMVDKLEEAGAKGLKSRLAGSMMASAFPRGLAGRNPWLTAMGALFSGHPELLGAIPFEMPSVVGRGGYALGGLQRSMSDMARSVGPALRPVPLVGAGNELIQQANP